MNMLDHSSPCTELLEQMRNGAESADGQCMGHIDKHCTGWRNHKRDNTGRDGSSRCSVPAALAAQLAVVAAIDHSVQCGVAELSVS